MIEKRFLLNYSLELFEVYSRDLESRSNLPAADIRIAIHAVQIVLEYFLTGLPDPTIETTRRRLLELRLRVEDYAISNRNLESLRFELRVFLDNARNLEPHVSDTKKNRDQVRDAAFILARLRRDRGLAA